MKTFDVFCSTSPAEGFGLTLIEARAAGVPVIACRTEAVREALGEDDEGVIWMQDQCGVAELAGLIERSMEGAGRKAMKPPPPEVLAGWSVEKMVDRYARWLGSL